MYDRSLFPHTTYYPNWQYNRLSFILNKFPQNYFKDKTVLELGSHHDYFGEHPETEAYLLEVWGQKPHNIIPTQHYPLMLLHKE